MLGDFGEDEELCPLHAVALRLVQALRTCRAALLEAAWQAGKSEYWDEGGQGYAAFLAADEVLFEIDKQDSTP